jgi:two-component system sensor histidine kinase KdpD
VADRVDEALDEYRARHGIQRPWETRERIVVAITGAPESDHLIRRAARMAQRAHGELFGVHVQTDSGLSTLSTARVGEHRRLLEELGGEYREVAGSDVGAVLIEFARAENATQIVLGASRRSWWQELTQGSVINRVVRRSGPIDVHVISADGDPDPPTPRRLPIPKLVLSPLPPRRQAIGWAIALLGLPLLTLVLVNLRDELGLPSVLLLYMVVAMAVAAVGGVFPALAAVVGGFLLANYYFTPPLYRFTVAEAENVLALVLYAGAAGIVSVLVDRIGRSRLEAAHARAEAEAMAALAGSLAEEEALPALIGHLRTTFGMEGVALLRRTDDGQGWEVEVGSGGPGDGPDAAAHVPTSPEGAEVVKEIADDRLLVMTGGRLVAEDHRVLNALAAQMATAVETRRLQQEAARATSLAQANDLRAALLQAVSHDLRTPLASIKASISSIRQPDVTWSPDQLAQFHTTIEEETDRLDGLVANLLDMSRIQAGALEAVIRPVGLEEVIPAAVASLGARGESIVVDAPETLPLVAADPALLERVLANLLDNAVGSSPPDRPVRIEAGAIAGRVDTRIVDEGPGIPRQDRDRVFQPFQRLVDHGSGVGLGLAISRGFVDAMGGELTIEDTPGGGVTMVVGLPVVAPSETGVLA